eukprot:FR735841.1.p1 GENE.FR735841.1~~FR735841.1.p1  ORF type:complete len:261 (+),score=0.80 FR735841.1:35-784(+)
MGGFWAGVIHKYRTRGSFYRPRWETRFLIVKHGGMLVWWHTRNAAVAGHRPKHFFINPNLQSKTLEDQEQQDDINANEKEWGATTRPADPLTSSRQHQKPKRRVLSSRVGMGGTAMQGATAGIRLASGLRADLCVVVFGNEHSNEVERATTRANGGKDALRRYFYFGEEDETKKFLKALKKSIKSKKQAQSKLSSDSNQVRPKLQRQRNTKKLLGRYEAPDPQESEEEPEEEASELSTVLGQWQLPEEI